VSLTPAGVVVRGLDLVVFDDWMRQEAHEEDAGLGLSTIFYPMGRLERMERDETVGGITSYADRFEREAGRTVFRAAGFAPEGAGLGAGGGGVEWVKASVGPPLPLRGEGQGGGSMNDRGSVNDGQGALRSQDPRGGRRLRHPRPRRMGPEARGRRGDRGRLRV